jgi:hypothetical protein
MHVLFFCGPGPQALVERALTRPAHQCQRMQYLAHTGCPLPPQPRLPAVLWLASQAVALEYRDRGAWSAC